MSSISSPIKKFFEIPDEDENNANHILADENLIDDSDFVETEVEQDVPQEQDQEIQLNQYLSNFRSKKSDKKDKAVLRGGDPNDNNYNSESHQTVTQNSNRLLTFKDVTSRESMMSEKRFSNPFITKKVLQSKRVYDVH